ncbi:thymidylate synthase [Lysinibacillus phage vB_LfM_LysYB1]|nr:thymidylate synthase [Lysinibacillus phage vB_LfM_LysYB1]WAB25203.1 thymidylate synthase [Lysinibacillus phage vB_LfM_LysYB2]
MANIFSSDNPSQMYLDALTTTLKEGQTVSPRGKAVKEIRPVILEFTNPLNRVTFVKGRKVNPFFQMAEALWILAGRADVEWLTHYNSNMAQFSDDGVFFNAPYGERLRYWNFNSARDFIFNPIDQLHDVLKKLQADKYSRQAVAVIYNPLFDNAEYGGKDTPCNLILTFKIRENAEGVDALDLTVFNRSNDVHWGTFGANLCQFTTIQETVAAWLGLPVGKYCPTSDSLHVYLDDYGAGNTDKIMEAYKLTDANWEHEPIPEVEHFTFPDEPRITLGFEDFNRFLAEYFNGRLDEMIHTDMYITDNRSATSLLESVLCAPDEYFKNTLLAMLAYRGHRLGNVDLVIKAMGYMKDSQWKLSCLFFLYNSYKDNEQFTDLYKHYDDAMKLYIEGVN